MMASAVLGSPGLRQAWRSIGRIAPPILLLIALCGLLEILYRHNALPVTIPAPSAIFLGFVQDPGALWYQAEPTMIGAAAGFMAASLICFFLALIAVLLPRSTSLIVNVAVVIHAMPLIAVAPILVVWFGTGLPARITIAALASFFPILVATIKGLQQRDRRGDELFHLLTASRYQRFRFLLLPSALPFIFSGLKTAAASAVLGAIISEWAGAERGLGTMMAYALFSFDVVHVWLGVLSATFLAVAAFLLVQGVEWLVIARIGTVGVATDSEERLRGNAGKMRILLDTLLLVVSACIFVACWSIAIVIFDIKPFTLPGPAATWAAFVANRSQLLDSLLLTLRTAYIGLGIGAALAIGLTIIFASFPAIARAVMPFVVAVRSAPIVASAPLITLIVGRGLTASLVIVAIGTVFPILVSLLKGVLNVPHAQLELMHVNYADRWQKFWRLEFPSAIPHLFVGLRTAAPLAVLGAMLAEWMTGAHGLGSLILNSSGMMDMPLLWAAILVSMLTGLAIFWSTVLLEGVAARR